MKRKIFISINIPPRVKKRLVLATEKWQDLPVKWTKENNLHITLFFLGYIDTEDITHVCQKVRDISENTDIFDLNFTHFELAPKLEKPQYIWLKGDSSEELLTLHEKIEKELGIFTVSKKTFSPHITIGRLRKFKWQELQDKPEISKKADLTISVESIDIMASDFGEGDSEFSIIESCPLR